MDNIINNLILIDKKARSIIKEAETKSQDIINSINLSKREFELKYDDKAEMRLKKVKKDEAEKIKNSCKEIKNKYILLMDKLERSYFKNHEIIENQLFNKIISEE